MGKTSKIICLKLAAAVFIVLGLPGPDLGAGTSGAVQAGTRVLVNYTCRAPGHGVIETTDPQVAENGNEKKSRVFSPKPPFKPVPLIAGRAVAKQPANEIEFLTEAIRNRLAVAVLGKKQGQAYKIRLDAASPETLEPKQRFLYFNTVEKYPRVRSVEKEKLKSFFGDREPEIGTVLTNKHGREFAEIIGVEGETVSVRAIIKEGEKSDHPAGISVVSCDDETIFMALESEVGLLVRSGGLIGEVVKVGDLQVVADFGHPFAGQSLTCDVEILEQKEQFWSQKQ